MKKKLQNISPVWYSLLFYFGIIEIIILIKNPLLFFNKEIFFTRLLFLLVFLISQYLKSKISPYKAKVITTILVFGSLSILYRETALLNQLFYPTLDPRLMLWDQRFFGFQPSFEFSRSLPYFWMSELMYFGYFSYYWTPLVIIYIIYKKFPRKLEEFCFILITSFLVYYIVFITFPAIGPQFFWNSPENSIPAQGIFGSMVKLVQKHGEVPTAAFPSSHVSVACIIFIYLLKNMKNYAWLFLPFMILLSFATVYIKAHYFVDVIAGFFTAPIVFFTIFIVYKKLTFNTQLVNEY